MTNSERASYIRGLMDGLELDPNAKETKVLNAIVELLDDLCLSVEELDNDLDELSEQVDEIDYDLGELEEDYYELEDEDECGCGCGHHHHHGDDFDDAEFEVTCPSCGDTIQLNDEMLEEGSIVCPGCGETLEFDFDERRGRARSPHRGVKSRNSKSPPTREGFLYCEPTRLASGFAMCVMNLPKNGNLLTPPYKGERKIAAALFPRVSSVLPAPKPCTPGPAE